MAQVSTRGRILKAGLEVFYALGFNGASVQDITDSAGVPKGSFYNHFKSKEQLALEVLGVYEALGRIELLASNGTSPLRRLRSHFKHLHKLQAGDCTRGCLFGNFALELSGTHAPIRAALQTHFDRWSHAVAVTLREAQAMGELEAGANTERLARHLVSSWEGAVMQMKVHQSTRPIDDFFSFMNASLQRR